VTQSITSGGIGKEVHRLRSSIRPAVKLQNQNPPCAFPVVLVAIAPVVRVFIELSSPSWICMQSTNAARMCLLQSIFAPVMSSLGLIFCETPSFLGGHAFNQKLHVLTICTANVPGGFVNGL
jgi:hypothetical protein